MALLQVLVATTGQHDFQLAEKMNLQGDAVIANQREGKDSLPEYREKLYSFGTVTWISTKTIGVGLNRNIALEAAEAEYLLFADDDMVYYDSVTEKVLQAFKQNPKADVIFFGIDISRNGKITEKRRSKNKRCYLWNSMKYGACRIAVRRSSIEKAGIRFDTRFGGGCPFSAGEDSLFIRDCLRHGLKVYSTDAVLGVCSKDTSTWFQGYNEKYFYDKGILISKLFPRMKNIIAIYFGAFFKRETELGACQRLQWMYRGIKAAKEMIPYEQVYVEKSK